MKRRFLVILCTFALLWSAAVYGNAESGESGGNKEPPGFNHFFPRPRRSPISSGDLNIHFLELGNKYTGDSVYINYGTIDILIDAGSRQSSALSIKAYIDNFIQDGTLEYVIATHAHRDHIAGFNSSNTVTGILDAYTIGTIIDFPLSNSSTAVYRNYRETRDRLAANGTAHYTALQCYNNEDGARRVYDFGGGVKLEILYNYYYENLSRNENNYSVCLRIIHDEKQFLFTGDLEREGEDLLVEFYDTNHGGLGHCVLYKGGHHGSNTSTGEKLMAAITPEYVCVCTCAGTAEYRARPENVFPSQAFVDRVAPYTDRVYITTLITDYARGEFMSFNGNIVFSVSGDAVSVKCGNNDIKLKDSEWFAHNREMPEAWASGYFP